MMDRDDFFSVPPSTQHAARVMEKVAPILEKARRHHRRKQLAWLFGAGLSATAAGFAVALLIRGRAEEKLVAELEPILEGTTGDEVNDIMMVAQENEDLNLDLLAELELLTEVRDEELAV